MAAGGKGGATGQPVSYPALTNNTGPNGPGVAGPPTGQPVSYPALTNNTGPNGPGAAQPAQAAGQQGYGVNPMNNAATGFQNAFNLLQNAMGYNQPNVPGSRYSPVTAQTPTAATAQAGQAATYNPATGQAQGYNAAQMQDPATIASLMGRYQNPYEDQVVQNTAQSMQDALRQTQMANSDAAIASGAFGGGRHGVVEGVSNSQTVKDIGSMTAQLRAQGFDTAAGLAGQDISNTMQTGAANQNAINQARGFNAQSQNDMSQFNANSQNQAGQFNANSQNNMSQFNTGQANQMNQFNAGLRGDMNQFNAGQQNQAGQFNSNTAMMNRQNYLDNAQGLASMLGNLSQASYGVGNSINQQQMQQGAMSQQLMQQILGQGQAGFDQQTQQAQQLLQMRLAALGMNPLNNATTTTQNQQTNPGWGSMFGNVLGAAGNMFSFNPIQLPWGQG